MNKQKKDLLLCLNEHNYINQRILSEDTGYSLGTINETLKELEEKSYIDEYRRLTNKSRDIVFKNKPKNAIILAAGYGLRMAPINTEVSKGLLEVKGEILIERIIRQLHEVNIKDILIVVGFKKEEYEYLIDEYNVKLIFNKEYSSKNNLHSLNLVSNYLSNSYIIPCDIWCNNNPFNKYELYSWYMTGDWIDEESNVYINRKWELRTIKKTDKGNAMIGICYLLESDAKIVRQRLNELCMNARYNHSFWEEALFKKNSNLTIYANIVSKDDVIEINTYEQLREFDKNASQLKNDAIQIIERELNVENEKIYNISVLKKGMTNRSFLFECKSKKYIMRIPGEGTDELIDRTQEANVYHVIKNFHISDELIYINPDNGYKITQFIENAKTCNPDNVSDLKMCMNKLKCFHNINLKVNHYFDLFEKIEYYQSLWHKNQSVYRDYIQTKENVLSLKQFIDSLDKNFCLTHIDAVPDNFLIFKDGIDKTEIRLIDWEYAAMQDPHVDIAMFCIYALYDKTHIDQLIDIYFENNCDRLTRLKIYSYISICGLLWSNWCEYKRELGVEFGDYSIRQYRYAKEFYKLVKEEGVLGA